MKDKKTAGCFFAVGVGPGDPSMITLQAAETIKNSDVIAVPDSSSGHDAALEIAGEHIGDRPVLKCGMPMIKDRKKLAEAHAKAAADIAEYLDRGQDVAFLTIGDPAVYSTAMYVHKVLTDRGYKTRMVPGVTSFCGAAASLNISLCERDEMLHIIPAAFSGMMQELPGARVLMKSGREIMKTKDEAGYEQAVLVENATTDREKICRDIKNIAEEPGYYSLVIIPGKRGEQE